MSFEKYSSCRADRWQLHSLTHANHGSHVVSNLDLLLGGGEGSHGPAVPSVHFAGQLGVVMPCSQ